MVCRVWYGGLGWFGVSGFGGLGRLQKTDAAAAKSPYARALECGPTIGALMIRTGFPQRGVYQGYYKGYYKDLVWGLDN